MSWIQVYVTGLAISLEPSDEDIEKLLDERYSLSSDDRILWAGPGTTMVKRDEEGVCRGFAFLAFYSTEGASAAINRINTHNGIENDKDEDLSVRPPLLRAELSNPKSGKKKPKKTEKYLPDLRVRKQRGAPVRKHPVITSSDGKRTNLGNKTK
mmetsp:Transcript_2498/g.3774  ORF Transcript_2498/g.3774 Transcript_2498/m.3774 type:complete len:154 (+) Transcript_2498:18-479(+)